MIKKRANWTPQMIKLLGKYPDAYLAKMWGMHYASVYHKRRNLGVDAYVEPVDPELVSMLGQVSDAEISSKLGIPRSTVFRIRSRLGVPAIARSDRRERGPSSPKHLKTPNTKMARWRLRMGYTQEQAATALGLGAKAYRNAEAISSKRSLLLACAAVEASLSPVE